MSNAVRYVVVAVVAFLIGGASYRLIAEGGKGEAEQEAKAAAVREFAVEGMTCQGCVESITAALKEVPGVTSANVSLTEKKAVVSADPTRTPTEKIISAIEAGGYKARLISNQSVVFSSAGEAPPKAPILVNITRGKNDLHAVSMALGLAQSAVKSGRPAVVFLNVEAAIFAANDLGDDVKFADFPPVKQMLADFTAAGGRVLVCGHCAHVVKFGQPDLIPGAKTVAHDELLSATPPGTVVFSY